VCDEADAPEGEICPYCGAIVRSIYGKGGPIPREVIEEDEQRRRAFKPAREVRLRERAKRHARAGAVVFGACALGLVGGTFCIAALNEVIDSTLPDVSGLAINEPFPKVDRSPRFTFILRFVMVFPVAALLGACVGGLLSRHEKGCLTGVVLGATGFSLAMVVVNLGIILASSYPLSMFLACTCLGQLPGAGAGYLLGYHILLDGA
jgi:hypothetical protein